METQGTDLFGEPIVQCPQKDWTGNKAGVFSCIGATGHGLTERAVHDFYATPPAAVQMLCDIEKFKGPIWEPACGHGHISETLKANGYEVCSTDLIARGYGTGGMDFLKADSLPLICREGCDVVTNPPYKHAREFVEHALELIPDGRKVAMFLKITFAEGKGRRMLFERNPPVRVWVSTSRLTCGKNGTEWMPSCICYAWWVWEKGYKGDTVLKWFN